MPTALSVELIRESYGRDGQTRKGERTYRVRFAGDGSVHSAKDAESASDGSNTIPTIGAAWSSGDPAKVKGRNATKGEQDQHTYEVTVSYSSESGSVETIENPLARPTDYSYEDESVTEPYFRDTDDAPVVNSAGDDFQDLPERERVVGNITITRNVATFNDATAQGYRDKINNADKTINGVTYLARVLRIRSWTATGPHEENDVTFWTETIKIGKRVDTWDDFFEDRGLNELEGGQPKPITDADGQAIQLPYPLDGSGAKKANATDAPAIITRKPYAAVTFPSL